MFGAGARALGWALVIGSGIATSALAQDDERPSVLQEETGMDPLQVQLNAGVAGFTGGLNPSSSPGPLYGVSASGTWSRIIGFEAGYEGSRLPIDDARVGPNGSIWRHDLYAMAKAAYPVRYARPFIGVGLGGTYVNVNDQADPFYRNDVYAEVPLALGVEYNQGFLTAGVRATYRFLLGDEFAEPTPAADNPTGGLLSGSLTVGARF